MAPFDNFSGDTIFFVDQAGGKIYSHKGGSTTGEVTPIFDMATDAPEGLTLDYTALTTAATKYRVKAMTQGPTSSEIIVVLTSTTLPPGWESGPDASLPPPGVHSYACQDQSFYVEDVYRFPPIPACAGTPFKGLVPQSAYDVMYNYKLDEQGKLTDPVPFFAVEIQVLPGHLGGGIATLPGGDILYATGDGLPFGMDGSYAAQRDDQSTSKLLRIDPRVPHEFEVVAKGLRNAQQIRLYEQDIPQGRSVLKQEKAGKAVKKSKKNSKGGSPKPTKELIVAFTDIGGVTAEEVNAFPLSMLESGEILNFGWGRSQEYGYAREGTYYVNPGTPFVMGTEPNCLANAPVSESGFCQPWVQFGRTPVDSFFGISSFQIPSEGMLELVWSEFNTGTVMGSFTPFKEGAPPTDKMEKLKMFLGGSEYLTTNDLVAAELGNGYTRGDPRLFHFPDGELGLLIERTGTFYKVKEIIYESPPQTSLNNRIDAVLDNTP
jgi:hypothetical protein